MDKSEACLWGGPVRPKRSSGFEWDIPCGSPVHYQDRGMAKKEKEVAQNHLAAEKHKHSVTS